MLPFKEKFPLNLKWLLLSNDLLNYFKEVTQVFDRIFLSSNIKLSNAAMIQQGTLLMGEEVGKGVLIWQYTL